MFVRKRLAFGADNEKQGVRSEDHLETIHTKPSALRPLSRLSFALIFLIAITAISSITHPNLIDSLRGCGDLNHSLNLLRSTSYFFAGLWSCRVYAVIIDCGSTGSRLLAFTFRKSILNQQLLLEEELWEEVKPGWVAAIPLNLRHTLIDHKVSLTQVCHRTPTIQNLQQHRSFSWSKKLRNTYLKMNGTILQ